MPKDYKEFISTYGTGTIDEFLWILTPFTHNKYLNLFNKGKALLDAYTVSKQQFPNYYRHQVFPEKNGLFPWAFTDNGDELYWLTKGSPNDWSIVIYESRSSDFFEYDKSISEFLCDVISRTIVCEAFPDDFPSENPKFYPLKVD